MTQKCEQTIGNSATVEGAIYLKIVSYWRVHLYILALAPS